MIAVTGASGELGGRVARRLADRGVEQRLVVRDRTRAPELAGAEVAVAPDYADAEAMRAAFEGVDTVYLVSAGEHPDRVLLHLSAVDAAVAAGAGRIVYVSFLAAAPEATFTFARDHFRTEEHIRATGLGFTFLRSSMYMDFLPLFVAEGVIRGPPGAVASRRWRGTTWQTRRGRAAGRRRARRAQLRPHGAGGALDGGGRRSPGRGVRRGRSRRRGGCAPTGAPDWEIEGWVTSYYAIATGEMDVVADHVRRLAGHEPMSLDEFLQDRERG